MNRLACTSVLAAILLAPARLDAAAWSIRAPDLKLSGSEWRPYNGGDSPEGGFMGWLMEKALSTDGELLLPQTLEPGVYYVFVKGINYGDKVRLKLACGGGGSPEVVPANRDWNGYWTDAIPIDVKSAADRVRITLLKGGDPSGTEKYLLRGLYITDREKTAVDANDTVIDTSTPATQESSLPVKGNLVPNGSFEVGLGQGWGFTAGGGNRDYAIRSLWEPTQAHHGQACVRIPRFGRLISRVLLVRANQEHTLSLWAKPADAKRLLTVSLYNVHGSVAGLKPIARLQKAFPLNSGWQRISISGRLPKYPNEEYQIALAASDSDVWVDAIQLEQGGASDYEPLEPVEIGLGCTQPGNIFFDDETIAMSLLARNETDRLSTAQIRCEIYDYLNRRIRQSDLSVSTPARSTSRSTLDASTGRRGVFRAVLWVDGRGRTEEEVVYCVVPRPRLIGPDPDSIIGIHANASDCQYESLQRLGVKWQRVLSPTAWFRWSIIEPKQGKFVWYDAEVQKTVQHGFTILGNISYWPSWADRNKKPDPDAWERSVFAIVDHYKHWVKHWEIWNEPIYEFTPGEYAELLRRAVRSIRRADPEAKVVGLGGSYKCSWCLDVLRELGGEPHQHMDYLATHLYPVRSDPRNPTDTSRQFREFHDRVVVPHGLPVWNTESGAWCLGFAKGPNSSFRSPGEPLWPHQDGLRYYRGSNHQAVQVAQNFLHSIGNGMSRFFYYDSRFHASPDYPKSHPTIFEFDDTVRAKGVAYATLAFLFDHSRGLGNISPDAQTAAYLFERNGVPLVAVFSLDDQPRTLTLPLDPSQFRAYDLMGNALEQPASVVSYCGEPVYLEGQGGVSIAAFRTAVERGRIEARRDADAPNVSISECPRGSVASTHFRVRWIAVDKVSVACDNTSADAVLYSYRLVGHETAWSDWNPGTWTCYQNLRGGQYRFEVRAKDQGGNTSSVVGRDFSVAPTSTQAKSD